MPKIFLDPGHGGSDSGAVGNGLQEKDLTLKIATYARNYLENNYEDVNVQMSRTGDSTISLSERTRRANNWGADIFVSVHINAGGGTGFESYVINRAGQSTRRLQDRIHPEIMKVLPGFRDRGQKQANFHVLRNSNMNAILTENLFIDTTRDANFLRSDANLKLLGEAHAIGIANYLGLTRIPVITDPETPPPSKEPSIIYEAHVQSIGWQGEKRDGQTAGTTGQSLRLEALTVRLVNTDATLEMQGHIQDIGWATLRTNGEVIGTVGEGLRLEAIRIRSDKLDISYRVHVQSLGWSNWMENGEIAGTSGRGLRIEAIEIKIS